MERGVVPNLRKSTRERQTRRRREGDWRGNTGGQKKMER